MRNNNKSRSRILIIGNRLAGDALLTIPALNSIAAKYPDCPIDVLAPASAAEIYTNPPAVENFIRLPGAGELLSRLHLIRKLRGNRYRLAVVFPGSFQTALLAALSGIPVRAGMSGDGRTLLLTRAWKKHPDFPLHQVDCAALTAQLVNTLPQKVPPRFITNREAGEEADRLLAQVHLTNNKPFVICAPGASTPYKQWGGFSEWLRIRRNADLLPVLITGTESEREHHLKLTEGCSNCYCLSGMTSLPVLAALLERAEYAVCNNSGTAHLATAVNCKTFMISGPSELNLTRPIGDQHRIIFSDLQCIPCSTAKMKRCRNRRCLTNIHPEHLEEAIAGDRHIKINSDGTATTAKWKPVAHPAITGKRVLIIGHNRLGDAAMTLPFIEQVAAGKPRLLSVTADGAGLQLYRHQPAIRQTFKNNGKQMIKAVRKLRYDTVFVLKDDFRSARLAGKTRIPVKIGYRNEGGACYLTRKIPQPRCHGRLRHLFLLPLPLNKHSQPLLSVHDTELSNAQNLQPPQIILFPGTTRAEKMWPENHWISLIKQLLQAGYNCALGGHGRCEERFNSSLAQKTGCRDLTGKTTVGGLTALLSLCRVVISCDNGPMHLADLLPGTTVIALFGQTDPELSGPASSDAIVLRSPAQCSPCLSNRCGTAPRCMEEIPVSAVVKAVKTIL